ncbi:hypothetical protein [Streptomyces sp. JJ36]|uniref:hypothetical protein n=1 Tax=Streptomyces sp. JJ36 TaxID=2736645 RepID=UPI001F3D9E3F|nr:hypothetical protein [Streptomyces sp. JJ36]MCF6523818.1 hypothetical protein [Streptomyces sp. JJ36]
MNSAREEWATALRELFGERAALASAAERSRHGWGHDANRIMARATQDPREWVSVDTLTRPDVDDTRYPFRHFDDAHLEGSLNAVPRYTARNLLVIMSSGTGKTRHIPNFEQRRHQLYAYADAVLSRFGPDSHFWTNVDDAPTETSGTDLGVSEWYALSDYTKDLGLVAASRTEVGVFWVCDDA